MRVVSQAARTALAAGALWVDTAPNYAHGLAHQELAPVLEEYPQARVATKTGFHTPAQGRAAVVAGVLTDESAAVGHSLASAFVRWQTENSLHVLGRADLVFVHNPERVWHDHGRDECHAQLRSAFAELESLAHNGRIRGYGIATWSGFTSGAFTVAELLRLAEEAAGSSHHHFSGLQLPVSLVMADPISQALDSGGPLFHARAAGVTTFGSAPLHGGELPDLMTPELVEFIRPGLSTPAAALLVAASCPALDVVLVSASSPEHWHDAARVLADPLAADRLRKVIDALATG
ncbi:aldo/keto reductase [Kitasatospora sp. MAP12-44]|uniref:aldo/keto reductase n=1 Tax=unclassified Kitasatospora TaxID=2633591 RepID=UPI002473528F|nr:aldo/keto reductase [Kitasatospora sp. MAP12-44]